MNTLREENRDLVERSVLALLGAGGTVTLHDVNTIVSILVGTVTCIYVVLNTVKLLRNWKQQKTEKE